jgi:hypothetical protein
MQRPPSTCSLDSAALPGLRRASGSRSGLPDDGQDRGSPASAASAAAAGDHMPAGTDTSRAPWGDRHWGSGAWGRERCPQADSPALEALRRGEAEAWSPRSPQQALSASSAPTSRRCTIDTRPHQQQQQEGPSARLSRQLREFSSLPARRHTAAVATLRKCVSNIESLQGAAVLRSAPSLRRQLQSDWQQGLAKAAGRAAAARLQGRGRLSAGTPAADSSSDEDRRVQQSRAGSSPQRSAQPRKWSSLVRPEAKAPGPPAADEGRQACGLCSTGTAGLRLPKDCCSLISGCWEPGGNYTCQQFVS